jgi:TPR repeat protein
MFFSTWQGSPMKILHKFLSLLLLCLFVVLGFCASTGICGSRIEDLRKAAEKGNAEAQFNLGVAYEHGGGVPEDATEAVKWYRKAAEQGNAEAQFNLGVAYDVGWGGLPKDAIEAVKFYRKAAEQGHVDALYTLGSAYWTGHGVPKDGIEAAKWYRKAAEQGKVEAQIELAFLYGLGDGVPKDEIEALAWFNIAAASGNQTAIKTRELLENKLGRQASLLAQQRSKEILKQVESAKQAKTKAEANSQKQTKRPGEKGDPKGSGTGAFVANDGLILTAAHVLGKSTNVKVITQKGLKAARIVKVDAANDLALLKCDGSFQFVPVKSSSGIKLGQSIFTIGFPNIGFQGFSPKMTKGEISSLSGLQDDPRHWQISVPVQPGNSGGPLFDEAGNVIGVVLAKLDAIKVAKFTGDLPQNVNYAVKSIYALPLLEPYAASLAPENAASTSPKMLESVVEKVQGAVVLILVY